MMRLVAILLAATACLPAQDSGPVISVSGPRLEAREIAAALPGWRPAAPDADLSPSPLPGIPRRISRGLLETWSSVAGANPGALPSTVVLERELAPLTPASAAEVIRSAVLQEVDIDPAALEIETPPDQDWPAPPAGRLEWKLIGRLPRSAEVETLRLRWQDAGGRTGVEVIQARVRARRSWFAAVRDLPARQRLTSSDFRLQSGWSESLEDSYPTTLDKFQEYELKRPLKSGEPLREGDLRAIAAVSRGDVLELEVRAGAVLLQISAQAEADGEIGESIPFKNLQTGNRVSGRIVSSHRAEAQLQ